MIRKLGLNSSGLSPSFNRVPRNLLDPTSPLSIVAHVCGEPLSRYRGRSRFPQNPGGFSGVAAVSRYTPPPLEGPVAPVALELPGVSHVKLPLKRCRATGGCSSYTVAGVALHCATKPLSLIC